MLLNCDVGKDSKESLGLQGDPTSLVWRKSVLNIHWKGRCWSWNSNTLSTSCKEPIHWKRPWCGERLQVGGEGSEDEMVGWHYWLSGHEFGQTPGNGDGWGSLTCYSPWGSQRVGHDWATELKEHLLPEINPLWYLEEWKFQRTYKELGAKIQAECRESGNWNYVAYIKMLLLLGTCHICKHWEHE